MSCRGPNSYDDDCHQFWQLLQALATRGVFHGSTASALYFRGTWQFCMLHHTCVFVCVSLIAITTGGQSVSHTDFTKVLSAVGCMIMKTMLGIRTGHLSCSLNAPDSRQSGSVSHSKNTSSSSSRRRHVIFVVHPIVFLWARAHRQQDLVTVCLMLSCCSTQVPAVECFVTSLNRSAAVTCLMLG